MRASSSLLLVLALASLAGANSVWFEPGAGVTWNSTAARYEYLAGAIVTVKIVADFDVALMDLGAIAVDNSDTAIPTQGVDTVGSLHPNLMFHPLGSSNGTLKPGDQSNIVLYHIRGGVSIAHPTPAPAGEALYSFDIQAGGVGSTITIDDPIIVDPWGVVRPDWPLVFESNFSGPGGGGLFDLDPLNLYEVPEPAALTMLALGAAMLLKKRRQ